MLNQLASIASSLYMRIIPTLTSNRIHQYRSDRKQVHVNYQGIRHSRMNSLLPLHLPPHPHMLFFFHFHFFLECIVSLIFASIHAAVMFSDHMISQNRPSSGGSRWCALKHHWLRRRPNWSLRRISLDDGPADTTIFFLDLFFNQWFASASSRPYLNANEACAGILRRKHRYQ